MSLKRVAITGCLPVTEFEEEILTLNLGHLGTYFEWSTVISVFTTGSMLIALDLPRLTSNL